ncbi:MAG: hypothetical protein AAF206_17380 [Bacteroidota bacterium]
MRQSPLRHIDKLIRWLEARLGPVGSSAIIGLLVFGIAFLFVSGVEVRSGAHGKWYQAISEDPFAFAESPVYFRLLGPMLGYLTALRGPLFLWLTAAFSIALPAFIFFRQRKQGWDPLAASGLAGLIGFSSMTYIHFIAQGYVDPISYFWVYLAFVFARKGPLMCLFFALAGLTHESNLVLFPALWMYAISLGERKQVKTLLINGLWVALAFVPLILLRQYIAAQTTVAFDTDFYLSIQNVKGVLKQTWGFLPIGIFYAFKLGWILPVLAVYEMWKRKISFWQWASLLMILLCVSAQALVAIDLGRLFDLAFPALLLAGYYLYEVYGSETFVRISWGIILLNFLLPQYFVAGKAIHPMFPIWFDWIKDWIMAL